MASNLRSKPRAKPSGFTLLEVLISMAILAMIAISIYQAMNSSFRIRFKLQNEGEFYQGVRLSMALLERDVTNLYSPKNAVPPTPPPAAPGSPAAQTLGVPLSVGEGNVMEADFTAIAGSDASRAGKFWSKVVDRTGIRLSRFQGDAKSISFVAVSNQRMYRNTPESEFVKVSYELRANELTTDKSIPEGSVLEKTVYTNAFALDEREEPKKYALLRGIQKLSFRFYQAQTGQYFNSWDTERSTMRHQYPDAIEVTVDVKAGEGMQFSGLYLFKPEIPTDALAPTF